jgi:hypothetical protein
MIIIFAKTENMKKPFQILLLSLLFIFSTVSLKAQKNYGDGTLILKSSLANTWDLNSSKFVPEDSNDFVFNSADLMTWQFENRYDPNLSKWTPNYILKNEYDSRGNNTLYVDSFLLPAEFDNRFKGTYAYNNDNNETLHYQSEWNTSKSDWEYYERGTTTYTGTGKESVDFREEYDAVKATWVNSVRRTYTYNGSDQLQFYIKEVWDLNANTWVNDYKILYFLNAKNYTDSMIYERFNKATQKWDKDDKFIYTFNASNEMLTNTTLDWVNNAWQPVRKNTYTYLADGQRLNYLYQEWDNATKALAPVSQTAYAYNAKNWLMLDSFMNWNKAGSKWELVSRNKHTYNANGYETSTIAEKYNSASSLWNNSTQVFYRYAAKQGNSLNKNPELTDVFTLFPNPANDEINLMVANSNWDKYSVSLMDSRGVSVCKLISSEPVPSSGFKIKLSNLGLAPGLYFVNITSEKGNTSLPLMIQ